MQIEVNLGPFLFIAISFIFLLAIIYLISHPVFFALLFISFIAYLIIWHAPDKKGPK